MINTYDVRDVNPISVFPGGKQGSATIYNLGESSVYISDVNAYRPENAYRINPQGTLQWNSQTPLYAFVDAGDECRIVVNDATVQLANTSVDATISGPVEIDGTVDVTGQVIADITSPVLIQGGAERLLSQTVSLSGSGFALLTVPYGTEGTVPPFLRVTMSAFTQGQSIINAVFSTNSGITLDDYHYCLGRLSGTWDGINHDTLGYTASTLGSVKYIPTASLPMRISLTRDNGRVASTTGNETFDVTVDGMQSGVPFTDATFRMQRGMSFYDSRAFDVNTRLLMPHAYRPYRVNIVPEGASDTITLCRTFWRNSATRAWVLNSDRLHYPSQDSANSGGTVTSRRVAFNVTPRVEQQTLYVNGSGRFTIWLEDI